jgi:hypothetical protein
VEGQRIGERLGQAQRLLAIKVCHEGSLLTSRQRGARYDYRV